MFAAMTFSASALAAGTLKVAVAPWYFPVIFKSDKGETQGIDYDVAQAIGKTLGMKVEFKEIPREKIGAAVAAGDVDIGLGAIEAKSYMRGYASAHVDHKMIKLVEYFDVPTAFVVREPDMEKEEKLAGRFIGTLSYTAGRLELSEWAKVGMVGRVFGFESDEVLINTLKLKRVHGILVSLPTAHQLAATSEGQWRVVRATAKGKTIREPLAIVLPANPADKAKAKKVNDAIEDFKKSGKISKIAAYWIEKP